MADTNLPSIQYGNGMRAVGRRDYDFHLYFTLKIKNGRKTASVRLSYAAY